MKEQDRTNKAAVTGQNNQVELRSQDGEQTVDEVMAEAVERSYGRKLADGTANRGRRASAHSGQARQQQKVMQRTRPQHGGKLGSPFRRDVPERDPHDSDVGSQLADPINSVLDPRVPVNGEWPHSASPSKETAQLAGTS